MNQLVKALPMDCDCLNYLCKKFPHVSEAKLKHQIFFGSDIRKLILTSK